VAQNRQNAGEVSFSFFQNIKIIFHHFRENSNIGYTAVSCMRGLLPKDITQSKFAYLETYFAHRNKRNAGRRFLEVHKYTTNLQHFPPLNT